MRAIIEVDVPDHQIGQEVSIYFKDTMMIKGIVQEPKTARWAIVSDESGRIIVCGHCGRVFPTMEPYCGNCGRRMLKPVKEEEA